MFGGHSVHIPNPLESQICYITWIVSICMADPYLLGIKAHLLYTMDNLSENLRLRSVEENKMREMKTLSWLQTPVA